MPHCLEFKGFASQNSISKHGGFTLGCDDNHIQAAAIGLGQSQNERYDQTGDDDRQKRSLHIQKRKAPAFLGEGFLEDQKAR